MKRIMTRFIKIDYWEKEERSFVIAMMLMVIFNFALAVFMLKS